MLGRGFIMERNKIMATEWIVVVNRTEARIFSAKTMQLIDTLSNSQGRDKNREFTSDRPGSGRNRSHAVASTHSLTGEKNPHDQVAEEFARGVNRYLKRRYLERGFDQLLVSAEARMQGWIKNGMEERIKSLTEWSTKDLVGLSDHELANRFRNRNVVRLPNGVRWKGGSQFVKKEG